jgi:hypothetical protein
VSTVCWVVAIERYGPLGGNSGLDVRAPIGQAALELASTLAGRQPEARVVVSHSLPDKPDYQRLLFALPASVARTAATTQGLQDALSQGRCPVCC